MDRIPVTIITGFLGAGKTTLLNRLISQPGFSDTAVVVNEFGEADIDGALVNHVEDRAFASTNGCLCCTVSGDVRSTLLRLLDEANRGLGPTFSRLVIETTGLADPGPVLRTFMTTESMQKNFVLNRVVTLVDAVYGADAIEKFHEAERQVAVADVILITKGDLACDPASRRDLLELKELLARKNPAAVIAGVEDATVSTVFSYATFGIEEKSETVGERLPGENDERHTHDHAHSHHHHAHDVNQHGDTASAFCFSASGPIDQGRLETAVSSLQELLGGDLLRLKGLVDVEQRPASPRVMHIVGHLTNAPDYLDSWPKGLMSTTLVMIVAGSNRENAVSLLTSALPQLVPFRSPFDMATA
ncbi:MAG: GTP-binding protein [Devosiaceae bacterium]|nr:GTP-binding protein [Devosiaceae bacterium MH13]